MSWLHGFIIQEKTHKTWRRKGKKGKQNCERGCSLLKDGGQQQQQQGQQQQQQGQQQQQQGQQQQQQNH
jgi:hypothetical protein